MKRSVFAATAVAVLAVPASALASHARGVVLSVDARHHAIEVVDSAHAVHLYHYRGRLPKLHPGSEVNFDRAGKTVSHLTAAANASRTVVFDARVVRSSTHGVVLRTADGRTVSFTSRQIAHKSGRPGKKGHVRAAADGTQINYGSVSINLLGLQPGVTVVVTETTDAAGDITITITLPPASQAPSQERASGVVTEVDSDAFVLATTDGSKLRLHMTADALSSLNLDACNTVAVVYHQDAGLLIADSVQVSGTSTTGDCTPTEDASGTITQLSGQTLTLSTDDGSMTFTADPSVTDGFRVGDLVDVTYPQGGNNATDVQYVEQDASGTVTAVQGPSLTITDGDSGQSETFAADPGNGVQITAQTFAGITPGDAVDVTYHQSAGHLVADTVCDNGPATNGSHD